MIGEFIEIVLQVFVYWFDFGKKNVEVIGWKQMVEFFFDSFIKCMFVIYDVFENNESGLSIENSYIFIKGVVECIIDLCFYVGMIDVFMIEEYKEKIFKQMIDFVFQGQCVFVIVYCVWNGCYVVGKNDGVDFFFFKNDEV